MAELISKLSVQNESFLVTQESWEYEHTGCLLLGLLSELSAATKTTPERNPSHLSLLMGEKFPLISCLPQARLVCF